MKNLLKLKRWEVGMKQYELANKLYCSAPYLSLVENDRIDPPEEFKAKAAAILHVDVDALFPGKNLKLDSLLSHSPISKPQRSLRTE